MDSVRIIISGLLLLLFLYMTFVNYYRFYLRRTGIANISGYVIIAPIVGAIGLIFSPYDVAHYWWVLWIIDFTSITEIFKRFVIPIFKVLEE